MECVSVCMTEGGEMGSVTETQSVCERERESKGVIECMGISSLT